MLHTSSRFGGVILRAFISRRRVALQRGLRMPVPPMFNNQIYGVKKLLEFAQKEDPKAEEGAA